MSASTVASPALYYIARSTICVNSKGESVGNGFFVNRDFGAGEAIVTLSRPLVGSLDIERLFDTCANCYTWMGRFSGGTRLYVPAGITLQKCGGCQRFRYCSKKCQKEAWSRGHKHECKALKPMPPAEKIIPKAVLACMELLSRKKRGLISDEDWTMLCRLPSHVEDFKRNGNYDNIELMAMGASQFSLTQTTFDRDFVAAMYARVLTNSLTLITPTLDPLGIVLDPTLGNLNHSCEPNAYIMMDGPEISVRTLKTIRKDEEVFISYIDPTSSFPRRQAELTSRWFFTCKCEKCAKGPTLDEDMWLSNNQPTRNIDQLDCIKFEAEMFDEYEYAQRVSRNDEALMLIRTAMYSCSSSLQWPLHRQPYAALRDNLILSLLMEDEYRDAWMHSAKRYKYIIPKLYPVHFHPVRVSQTWQMAMLATYLASVQKNDSGLGLNMSLIAMMLVRQVLDATSLSHGLDNTFTKSVKLKAEEMVEELKNNTTEADMEAMNRELERQRDLLMDLADWVEFSV
ncbi:hypothetical protein ACN47E_009114 [Coniothyrium glycines]